MDTYVLLRRKYQSLMVHLDYQVTLALDCPRFDRNAVSFYEFSSIGTSPTGLGLRTLLQSRPWLPREYSSRKSPFRPYPYLSANEHRVAEHHA